MAMQRCRTRCWCGRSTSRISCRRRHWDQGMVDSVDENWGYPYGKHPYEHEARLGTYKQRWRERFWPRAMCETCLLWQIMGDRKTCWRLWAMVICIVFGRYSEGRGEWRKGGWLAQMWVEKHGKKKSMNIYVFKKTGTETRNIDKYHLNPFDILLTLKLVSCNDILDMKQQKSCSKSSKLIISNRIPKDQMRPKQPLVWIYWGYETTFLGPWKWVGVFDVCGRYWPYILDLLNKY